MGADPVRHPVIVDTDALIAVANTSLWSAITETLQLTTTNVCIGELERHVRETHEFAPEGSRPRWLHDGSATALEPFTDADNQAFTTVTVVPRPHGPDAGETSIKQEVQQHPTTYQFAILMDAEGRRSINRVFTEADGTDGTAVAPPFLLYLVLDAGACTTEEFCQACGEMLRGEGWTGYQAVQAAWEAIPVDCTGYLDEDILP